MESMQTKAFVLAFSQSPHHELNDKNLRVQAVLPGAAATEFWAVAGHPIEHLPSQIVMSVEDVVDAALTGLDLVNSLRFRLCHTATT